MPLRKYLATLYGTQGWTALAKPMSLTPWCRHGQSLPQGSPGILLLELDLLFPLLRIGPGKIHH